MSAAAPLAALMVITSAKTDRTAAKTIAVKPAGAKAAAGVERGLAL